MVGVHKGRFDYYFNSEANDFGWFDFVVKLMGSSFSLPFLSVWVLAISKLCQGTRTSFKLTTQQADPIT